MSEYAGNSLTQAQGSLAGGQATAKKDTISNVALDLDRSIERLSKMYDALRHIGDRVDGSRPEPIGTQVGAPDVPPASMILDMRRKHTATSSLIGKCEDEIQRLAVALGIS